MVATNPITRTAAMIRVRTATRLFTFSICIGISPLYVNGAQGVSGTTNAATLE